MPHARITRADVWDALRPFRAACAGVPSRTRFEKAACFEPRRDVGDDSTPRQTVGTNVGGRPTGVGIRKAAGLPTATLLYVTRRVVRGRPAYRRRRVVPSSCC